MRLPKERRALIALAIAVAVVDYSFVMFLGIVALFEADASSTPPSLVGLIHRSLSILAMPLLPITDRLGWASREPPLILLNSILWGAAFYAFARYKTRDPAEPTRG
jgi:hypothetical protein